MSKISVGDLFSYGLIFISIWIFLTALKQDNLLLKIIGLIGSVIIFISELVFVWQKYINKNEREV